MKEFETLTKIFSEPNEQKLIRNSNELHQTKKLLEEFLKVEESQCKDFKDFGYKLCVAEMTKEISAIKTTINLIDQLLETLKNSNLQLKKPLL